jgi:tetratricopeptide (TPR) repeat protein
VATKFLRAGRDAEAVEAFEKLVSLDPNNPLPHLRLAEALARSRDVDGSITQFSIAADMLMQLGRRDDALKVFDRLLQIRQDPTIAKRAATVLLERNQPGDGMTALKYLRISVQSNPKELETLELLARTFEVLGQTPKALEVLKETARVARDQNNHDVLSRVLGQLLRAAPNDEAVQSLARAAGLAQPQPPPRAPQPPARPTAPVITTSEEFDDFDEPISSSAIIEDDEADLIDDGELLDEDDGMAVRDPFARSSHAGPASVGVVSVPSSIRAAEDVVHSHIDDLEADAITQQALSEVLGFRRARQPARAIECLRINLEVLPGSVVLREQLRDLLLETGDRNGAVGELITLATLAIEQGDEEQAQNLLSEVLLLVPGHERAREMLATLSFGGLEPIAEEHSGNNLLAGDDGGIELVDPSEPLASYDLEEVGADEALSHRSSPPAAPPALELDADDPFDAPPVVPVRLVAQGPGPVRPYVPPAQPVRAAALSSPATRPFAPTVPAIQTPAPAPVAATPAPAVVPRPVVSPPRPAAPSAPVLAPPRPVVGPPRPAAPSAPVVASPPAPAPTPVRATAPALLATPARAPVPDARPMMVTPVAPPVAEPVFEIDDDPFLTSDSEDLSADISPTAPAGYVEPELDDPSFLADDATPAFSHAEYDPTQYDSHQGRASSFDQLDAPDELEPVDDLDRAAPNPFDDTVDPALALDEPTGPPVLATSIKAFQGGDSIEDAMEEVDFFASRGLFEDARAILDEQLARSPKNRLLLDRLDELNEAEAAAQPAYDPSPATDDGAGASVSSHDALPVSTHGGQQAFDEELLDASLDALDAFEPTQEAQHHFQQDDEQVDVEAVFAKFKEGVKKQVDDSDSATHYDLGVAYKEMGLLQDAIQAFELAARDPSRACVCHSMVAMIELERDKPDAAIRAFQRALAVEQRTSDQELSLWYELGLVYEMKRLNTEALTFFRKVQARDPQFRDVAEKIRLLEPPAPKKAGRQINNDEDFDLVFDDILGGGKP